jgi:hypothetical protein
MQAARNIHAKKGENIISGNVREGNEQNISYN